MPAGVSYTDFGAAARIYWTLKVAGVAKVSILDGGYAAWVADGERGRDRTEQALAEDLHRDARTSRCSPKRATSRQIEQRGGATLVDARPASFFAGKEKAPAAQGLRPHPRRHQRRQRDVLRCDDQPAEAAAPSLRRIAATAVPAGPAVTYCNTGHWAATDWFVLSELLGRKDVKLYYGSMVDWTSDASRPLASARTKWDDLKKKLGFGS